MSKDHYNVTDLAPLRDVACDIKILMLPMRDGVKLQTVLFFPPSFKGRSAAVLVRTPYTRTTEMIYPDSAVLEKGFVFILQACRGTGWSEGLFDPADEEYETKDAADLLDWLGKQPWYNGRCAMMGASYPGWVQWAAQMAGKNLLTAVAPHVAPVYGCVGSARPGGAVSLSFTQNWMLSMHHRRKYGYSGVPDYTAMKIHDHLPVIESDRFAKYPALTPFRKFLLKGREPGRVLTELWERFSSFTAPAYITGGWFDGLKNETVTSFLTMKNAAASPEARQFTRMVIGPWAHAGLINPEIFGKNCDYRHVNKWRERFIFNLLKNPSKDPLPNEPAVRYYMLCENKWYDAPSWPPPATEERPFYLHSSGRANSSAGDGTLSEVPPQQEPCDVYLSDPAKPVFSDRGTHACLGCYDRSEQQKRSDVLVYTTPVMTAPLAAAGPVKVRFTASATTPDTDFAAVLSWVTPEGKSMFLAAGLVRARFRNIHKEELIEPGKLYDYEISLSHTAFKIMPGCALRLELCGQHFPALDRNANSGGPLFEDTELYISRHTIFHDAEHPAALILNVLKQA